MALKLASGRTVTGRAAALRDVLSSSNLLAREATQVLDGYGGHLNELIESVELVADRAQVKVDLYSLLKERSNYGRAPICDGTSVFDSAGCQTCSLLAGITH